MRIMFCLFVFFKQKTAYEMRISDWSSDVCSSDLLHVSELLFTDLLEWAKIGACALRTTRTTGRKHRLESWGVYVSAAIAPATGDINKEIFRRLIVETDCPTGFFSLAVYNADTVCQPECGLIFACRPGEISILGSGGISQRAATAGANIIPAVASAKIQRQLIGDLVSDLAIKCLVLVFDVRRRERDARGIGGECNKMRTARL